MNREFFELLRHFKSEINELSASIKKLETEISKENRQFNKSQLMILKQSYLNRQIESTEIAILIENRISQVDNPIYRRLLHLRYVECLEWDKVSEALQYGISQTYVLHKKALQSFSAKLK